MRQSGAYGWIWLILTSFSRQRPESEGFPDLGDQLLQALTLSFLLALNFFRHSTVSCLCIMDATVERCCEHKGEGLRGVRRWESQPFLGF